MTLIQCIGISSNKFAELFNANDTAIKNFIHRGFSLSNKAKYYSKDKRVYRFLRKYRDIFEGDLYLKDISSSIWEDVRYISNKDLAKELGVSVSIINRLRGKEIPFKYQYKISTILLEKEPHQLININWSTDHLNFYRELYNKLK
jgi:DNA-binding Xre family transcriptional regulator